MARLNRPDIIAKYSFCLGVAKYIAAESRKGREVTPVDTILAGFTNSIIISVMSAFIPEGMGHIALLIDTGCFTYSIYKAQRSRRSPAPRAPQNTPASAPPRTEPGEELVPQE